MSKVRLDALIVERGLADSLELARALIMGGKVYIGNARASTAGMQIDPNSSIIVEGSQEYVSRGGLKLSKALEYFGISPVDKICIDCGASTGGFTDCLLKNGAKLVYAVDVGYGQLAWSLRNDPRVISMERTNIRYVTGEMLNPLPSLATLDLSFISLGTVLSVVKELLVGDKDTICLIKPQFEAERENVGNKGVVSDMDTHIGVLDSFCENAFRIGYMLGGLTHSPIRGAQGNIEYLAWLRASGEGSSISTAKVVSKSYEYFAIE
ncbi:MAG: TlyA family RNA methyltransferase [Oscillospiraceae bacterium]|nr:TlyA family RNA methyltransferase [Oscillospiraceae bacterium]